ncbi:MAG: hypothetical protein M1524_03190 [Patescibacteria group bacterium]|nr:hypothetical protein [Patescibacteria group bacterium]
MKKIFILCFFLFFFTIILPKNIQASENFETSYRVTYTVSEDGNTHALFNVGLKNKTSQYYAQSYAIDVGFNDIRNIKAYDGKGAISPVISPTKDGKKIDLTFNERVLGKDNVLNFNLSFDTNDVAYKLGNIWEINIPGISQKNDFSDFNVDVIVPKTFGEPTYIKPRQSDNKLSFNKEELGRSGISIAFGEYQIYDFDLKYHIGNTSVLPVTTEIALPPTTNYQEVFIDSIDPKPLNVVEDRDGNWLAKYRLLPSQKLNIVVKGKAEIYLYPRKQKLSERDAALYLKEKKYWELSDVKIKELARQLGTPQKIYDFTVQNLTYDFSRVTDNKERLGAKNILNNPSSAVCLEFTDLFIALARSAGIPAREIDGFASTENSKQRPLSLVKDILHAWPEYYDKNMETWVMVDPTWGNTTGGIDYFNVLDFDHFAFIIKGQESDYPIPAGGYKISGTKDVKDVNVVFSKNPPSRAQNFEISADFPKSVSSGVGIKGNITIKNTSTEILKPQNVVVLSDSLTPNSQSIAFSQIPPFGSETKTVEFKNTPVLTNKKAFVTITSHGREITASFNISPLYFTNWIILGGILLGIFVILIFIIATRARDIPFFKRKKGSDLRGEGQEPQK